MQNDKILSNNILYKIVIASFLMIPLSFAIQMLGRLNFYLTPVTMAVYPIIMSRVNNSLIRQGFITLFVLFTAYTFWSFFQSPVWERAFGIYKTIFSAPRYY
jgi:branched-subunit amino acid permease